MNYTFSGDGNFLIFEEDIKSMQDHEACFDYNSLEQKHEREMHVTIITPSGFV